MTIGERILLMRQRRGWNQVELAHRSGVSQAQISALESGKKTDVTSRTLRRLALALGVTTDWLAGMYQDEDGQPFKVCPAGAHGLRRHTPLPVERFQGGKRLRVL